MRLAVGLGVRMPGAGLPAVRAQETGGAAAGLTIAVQAASPRVGDSGLYAEHPRSAPAEGPRRCSLGWHGRFWGFHSHPSRQITQGVWRPGGPRACGGELHPWGGSQADDPVPVPDLVALVNIGPGTFGATEVGPQLHTVCRKTFWQARRTRTLFICSRNLSSKVPS